MKNYEYFIQTNKQLGREYKNGPNGNCRTENQSRVKHSLDCRSASETTREEISDSEENKSHGGKAIWINSAGKVYNLNDRLKSQEIQDTVNPKENSSPCQASSKSNLGKLSWKELERIDELTENITAVLLAGSHGELSLAHVKLFVWAQDICSRRSCYSQRWSLCIQSEHLNLLYKGSRKADAWLTRWSYVLVDQWSLEGAVLDGIYYWKHVRVTEPQTLDILKLDARGGMYLSNRVFD